MSPSKYSCCNTSRMVILQIRSPPEYPWWVTGKGTMWAESSWYPRWVEFGIHAQPHWVLVSSYRTYTPSSRGKMTLPPAAMPTCTEVGESASLNSQPTTLRDLPQFEVNVSNAVLVSWHHHPQLSFKYPFSSFNKVCQFFKDQHWMADSESYQGPHFTAAYCLPGPKFVDLLHYNGRILMYHEMGSISATWSPSLKRPVSADSVVDWTYGKLLSVRDLLCLYHLSDQNPGVSVQLSIGHNHNCRLVVRQRWQPLVTNPHNHNNTMTVTHQQWDCSADENGNAMTGQRMTTAIATATATTGHNDGYDDPSSQRCARHQWYRRWWQVEVQRQMRSISPWHCGTILIRC